MGNVFGVISGNYIYIYLLALRKYKMDSKIPEIILVPGFCPLSTEMTEFLIGFRLNFPTTVSWFIDI